MASDESKERVITGEGGPEAAEPQPQPDNVVTDNAGVIPVQPVATSDPTINDNTNPKVFFDGADPRNIPPHDSNEQLHISASKRMGAELSSLTTAAEQRRQATEAAYDNTKDVRDVVGDDNDSSEQTGEEAVSSATRRAAETRAAGGNAARKQPPQGRTATPPSQAKS